MTGLDLLNKLKNLSVEELSHEIWFVNEDICSKLAPYIETENDPTYEDTEGYEVLRESDYSEEEIEEMLNNEEITPLTRYGDLILTCE